MKDTTAKILGICKRYD